MRSPTRMKAMYQNVEEIYNHIRQPTISIRSLVIFNAIFHSGGYHFFQVFVGCMREVSECILYMCFVCVNCEPW